MTKQSTGEILKKTSKTLKQYTMAKKKNQLDLTEVSPTDAEWIAPMLKVWADHYPFIAEMKGRSVQIRPKHIIVTSNYSLEEIFKNPEDLEPLKRRFKQVHMIGYDPKLNSFS